MLTRCSLNGIDDSTSFADIRKLKQEFPFAEFGVCLTERPGEAGTGCYASKDRIREIARRFSGDSTIALHVCYRQATDDFIHGTGFVTEIAPYFARIQLNYNHGNLFDDTNPRNMANLLRAFDTYLDRNVTIITTHNPEHPALAARLRGLPNHEVLFDISAGRGMTPDKWPSPLPDVPCGYAGGLCPENLKQELPLIHAAATRRHSRGEQLLWVDMESRLRAGRRDFPMDPAEDCLRIFRTYIESRALTRVHDFRALPRAMPGPEF